MVCLFWNKRRGRTWRSDVLLDETLGGTRRMGSVSNLFDGGKDSPFRKGTFLFVSAVALGSVVADAYLVYRHMQTTPVYVAVILSTPIGVQLVYQWFRVLLGCAKMQELRAKSSTEEKKDGSLLDAAARMYVRGMIDLLFYSYGIAIFALILIGLLLSRLDGLR
jgi:hypothetical protein